MTDVDAAAAWAVVHAVRTAEATAARRVAPLLADDVRFVAAHGALHGAAAVLDRLTGLWPWSPVLAMAAWRVGTSGGSAVATAEMPGVGAVPSHYTLEIATDGGGRIAEIVETVGPPLRHPETATVPPGVRRAINRALADGKPVMVGYVGANGVAALSLRGSLQVVGDDHVGLWLRNGNGGLATAIRNHQPISLLYRDSATRTTLSGTVVGAIVDDPARRDAIYAAVPEIEQRHDPARHGAAALLDIVRLGGATPDGFVTIRPRGHERPANVQPNE